MNGPEGVEGSTPSPSLGASETPTSWRFAALGLLAGGITVGLLAGHKKLGRVVPLITAGVAIGCSVPVALASRKPPISPDEAADALADADLRPTFSIVVGARDEAAVLARLVGDVARSDYRNPDGRPLFELIVVDDRSTDGTAEVVRAAAREAGIGSITRVVLRRGEGLPDGKGAALTAAQPDICNGDIVLVLDADARFEPWFLSHAAGYFVAGAKAVTARRRILDAESGWLAGAQADEQTLDGELNRGRWAMGGCSEFRGNGIMIRRDLLAEVGGWRAEALTEDIDLSSRIAALAGERVAWAVDAEVWEEPVRTVGRLWQQRLRWAEGALRRAFEHGPAVVRSRRLPVAARLDFVAYVGQLAVPGVFVGAAASAAITGRKRSLISILLGYLGISALLGWDSLRWETGPGGRPLDRAERSKRALRVSLLNGIWLAALPRALADLAFRRGPIRYVKMEHDGAGEPDSGPSRGRAEG
jgi:cellulose synthase/poly-beta-1,6-N-acetylglucosamine synthase-like glycosyltransferase